MKPEDAKWVADAVKREFIGNKGRIIGLESGTSLDDALIKAMPAINLIDINMALDENKKLSDYAAMIILNLPPGLSAKVKSVIDKAGKDNVAKLIISNSLINNIYYTYDRRSIVAGQELYFFKHK